MGQSYMTCRCVAAYEYLHAYIHVIASVEIPVEIPECIVILGTHMQDVDL